MAWSLPELLHKGFDLASDILSYLRDGDEGTDRAQSENATSLVLETKVLTAIDDVSRKLDLVAQDIVSKVSQKLEHDQLERLSAQIKAVKFGIQFGDESMLKLPLVQVAEQIEYAKHRIAEGKYEWLGPWMMAESIRLVGLREIARNDAACEVLKREALSFRLNILDFTGDFLLKAVNSPWVKISEFVEGRNEDVLRLIENSSDFGVTDTVFKEIRLDKASLKDWHRLNVLTVSVKVGSEVKAGDQILQYEGADEWYDVLFHSPESGTVAELHVKSGDKLEKGALLVTLRQG
ncbi:hypothetical protein PCA31118_05356 [Pandoraea captiosa]|uniref:Lipoyl-binding domain-containing protein n=1 Tax=Pandoraea captiosa TaxID=2508302 RepID=A0A5E5AV69_9BURK|nr:acetyl-CoA carboxylase biotin carboxyl carrier protein subunit [Pandoraea captiosa]VVE77006.1 hypothetical protein PCA31118_05356 [Pandoraea captiosa]